MNGGDPTIKLFGRKIPVPESQIPPAEPCGERESRELIKETEKPTTIIENIGKNKDDEQVFKKPEKVLPCPRCNSSETKFCYFNNYNVNQPRHFCKSCQRYWTAGGTMRNVPIGAGRRRNKQLASQYHQIDSLESANDSSTTTFKSSIGNGVVLNFGGEIETRVRLGDQKTCMEIQDEPTVRTVEKKEQEGLLGSSDSNVEYPVPRGSYPVHWVPAPMVTVPGFCWAGMPVWTNGSRNVSMAGSVGCLSPSFATSNSPNGSKPRNLGKHCREGSFIEEDESENCVLVPKTLRIDDPNEAWRSPIWATLGIKPLHRDAGSTEDSVFKAFYHGNDVSLGGASVLEANSAAISRFRAFQERT